MLLTCITTTFNEGPLLMTSVRSILGQTMGDFELLIVDDGSGPETVQILQGLDDPRIRVIRQANDGLSSARNRALGLARGDYVTFLDADDSRPNWAFAAIASAIAAHRPDLILCPGALQEVRGEFKTFYDQKIFDRIEHLLPLGITRRGSAGYDAIRALAHRIEPQSANKVLSRDFLRRTGLCFPNGHFFEDIFFHTGAVAMADSIAFLDAPAFCYFRRHARSQITSTNGELRLDSVAVTRLTLDSFSRRAEFEDPELATSVLMACLKILSWCESEIGHPQRPAFRLAVRAMLRLVDPRWYALPCIAEPGADAALVSWLIGLENK